MSGEERERLPDITLEPTAPGLSKDYTQVAPQALARAEAEVAADWQIGDILLDLYCTLDGELRAQIRWGLLTQVAAKEVAGFLEAERGFGYRLRMCP